jgi:Ca2+-binding RTX toxin-like protein
MRGLVAVVALVLALPATAQAGTATVTGTTVNYVSAGGPEDVTVGFEGPDSFVRSNLAVTGTCTPFSAVEARCVPGITVFAVTFAAGNDSLRTENIGAATITVHGGPGADDLEGTPGNDIMAGEDDGDSGLAGLAGNDSIDGGPGDDQSLDDGPGNDIVSGGPGNDTVHAGTGADVYSGGDGNDTIFYTERTVGVTITDNGVADDGEPGEGDNATSFEDVTGGAGNDTIVGNDAGDRLHGLSGNDYIKGGAAEDRIEGGDGDDTIDSRDGRYDSIDCGPGNDTVYGDPADATEGCEVAPDPDGDGYLAPQDCAPTDPLVHPGAGEVFGNPVDEDCQGGPGYLRVISPVNYKYVRSHGKARFTKLLISELKKGDKIEIRCNSRKKGCPFTRKKVTIKAGHKSLNVAKLLKKRLFKRGAVLEVRILRANQIGKVQRYKVGKKGSVTAPKALCVKVGKTTATRCS